MQPDNTGVCPTFGVSLDQSLVRQMPRLMEETPDNSTTIYYWQGKSWSDFGHVAMLVRSNGRAGVYVSFTTVHSYFPLLLLCCCYGTAGTFVQRSREQRDCDSKITITKLDHAAIYDAALELIEKFNESCKAVIDAEDNDSVDTLSTLSDVKKTTQWGICGHRMTCASVVLDLLIAGGLKARAPVYGNIRQDMENITRLVSHVALLSLRPTFSLFALMPLSYSLISAETPSAARFYRKLFFSTLLSSGIFGCFFFEKYVIPRFDTLKSTAFRGRELVEINPFSDSVVALMASMTMGVSALFYRFHPLEDAFSGAVGKDWLILGDAFLWTLVSGSVYLGVGITLAVTLGWFNGRFVKTPDFVHRLSRYLAVFDGFVDSNLIEQQFRKEKTLLFLNGLILPTVFVAHCYNDELLDKHHGNFKLQLIGSAIFFVGYLITKARIIYLEQQDRKLAQIRKSQDNQPVLDQSVQSLLSSNEPKVELFSGCVIFSGLVQLVASYQLSAVIDDTLAAFLTSAMVFVTYAMVIFAYSAMYHPARKYFPCCFFERETANEMTGSIQDSSIEEEARRLLSDDEAVNGFVVA
nr:hypothetical protein 3 [Coxiellaceae bacterium]